MLPIIFIAPILQLLILSNAATYEIKSVKLHVQDMDMSTWSSQLIQKFEGSPYFEVASFSFSDKDGINSLQSGSANLFISIPNHFEKNLRNGNNTAVKINIDAIDGAKAGVMQVYALSIIRNFNKLILPEVYSDNGAINLPGNISTIPALWYNPELDYITFMVPGILVLLVTMVALFLAGMNIVREREIGTIEQLNVTPVNKYQFIIGKMLPFWLLGMFELALGLVIGKLVFSVPMEGSVALLFAFAAIYMILILGMGLFFSTFAETQQQAMFISWFFMVIFILMSGLFTPIESMPQWAQAVTRINPISYFIDVMRLVMLKGAGLVSVQKHFYILGAYAIGINVLAVLNYKKRV